MPNLRGIQLYYIRKTRFKREKCFEFRWEKEKTHDVQEHGDVEIDKCSTHPWSQKLLPEGRAVCGASVSDDGSLYKP